MSCPLGRIKGLIGIAGVVIAIALAGCAQTPTPGVGTPTLRSPQSEQATFTPQAAEPSPAEPSPAESTPTAALPSPTPEAEQPTPSATPEATEPPQAEATPTETGSTGGEAESGCINKAAFFKDVNVPDGTSFKQDVAFTKTWQIRNEGTCTWDGYKLVFAGGNNLNGPPSNALPRVAPGQVEDISVELKSPPQGGVYTSYWEFESAGGERFGVNSHGKDLIWVEISVSWYDESGQPTGNVTPQAGDAGGSGACPVEQDAGVISQLLGLINQARAEAGVPALKLQDKLNASAFAHSQDMACEDFIDHTGSDGSSWYDRIKAQSYAYTYASENIYVGNPAFGGDAAGAFDWWMHSDIHRKNILSPKVTEIGIGYAYHQSSTYGGYYTLNFAHP